MEGWAEVQRLFHREGLTKRAIARRLGMSRTTVIRLLGLRAPPRYVRPPRGSLVDPYVEEIAALLYEDPEAPATVILDHLRRAGYGGGISILKEHLARVRPGFRAARAFQRTAYLPGEIGQLGWWHTGVHVPVGQCVARETFGLVLSLHHSGAPATVFTLGRTAGDSCVALIGCLCRLDGVPEKLVHDHDGSIVAEGSDKRARLHPEVSVLIGRLHTVAVPRPPRAPTCSSRPARAGTRALGGLLGAAGLRRSAHRCGGDTRHGPARLRGHDHRRIGRPSQRALSEGYVCPLAVGAGLGR